jgi:hypothetical protein
MGIYNWPIIFFYSSFCNVGYEKLRTIYNHHIENTLNNTSIKCGFDIFLLSYLLFIIKNLCCNVFVGLLRGGGGGGGESIMSNISNFNHNMYFNNNK